MGDVLIINKKIMMDYLYTQLAIDYNCSPDDLLKDGLFLLKQLNTKTGTFSVAFTTPRDEVFYMPFAYGISPYFMPDIGKFPN